eukprot:Rmarinus@m.22149
MAAPSDCRKRLGGGGSALDRAPKRLRRPSDAMTDEADEGVRLLELPPSLLEGILCRVRCEVSLLGGVAKVGPELRRMAVRPRVREAVQRNVIRAHPMTCPACRRIADNIESASFDDLLASIRAGRLHCVVYLSLATGGRLTHDTDLFGTTALHCVVQAGRLDLVQYLVEECAAGDLIGRMNNDGQTAFLAAAEWGRLDMLRYFVDKGAAYLVHGVDCNGETVLLVAAGWGRLGMARFILGLPGASSLLRQTNNEGDTVLHRAASSGSVHLIRHFVEHCGVSDLIHRRNNHGDTVLHAAAGEGKVGVIRYFLETKGVAGLVDRRNCDGHTVVQKAASKGHSEVIRYFVEVREGVDLVDKPDVDWHEALNLAIGV